MIKLYMIKLFIKLSNYGINKEIINAIKIIYSNAKIKISSNDYITCKNNKLNIKKNN